MKKFSVFLATILLVILCVPTIMACSCTRIIATGYYKLQQLQINVEGISTTINKDDINPLTSTTLTEDSYSLVLHDDKTGFFVQDSTETPLTWSQKRTNVSIELQENTYNTNINGHTLYLTMDYNGTQVTFVFNRSYTTKYVGTYKTISYVVYSLGDNGTSTSFDTEINSNLADYRVYNLVGDGTYTLYSNGSELAKGEWRKYGDQIIFSNSNFNATIQENLLVFETTNGNNHAVLIVGK